MSVIEQNSQIPEMYKIRHKHDTINHEDFSYDYSEKLYSNSISRYILMNNKVRTFTNSLTKMVSIMIDESHYIKNLFFYTHKKYYNKNAR